MSLVHRDTPLDDLPHQSGETDQTLRVYLLGTPVTEAYNRPLSIPRRQVRSLLYYLAAHSSPVQRERLCFLYWPDIPESDARRNLNRLVNLLRKSLPAPDFLLTYDDQIALGPNKLWVDTHILNMYCTDRNSEAADQAITIYRGSFLEGFSLPACPEYENWILREARHWERCYLSLLGGSIIEHIKNNDFDKAISFAQRYLEHDELAEDIHRKLIELYLMIGDRNAALHQYERCLAALERELGVSPLPETQELVQSLNGGEMSGITTKKSEPSHPIRIELNIPLIGRADALEDIQRVFQQVRLGQGRFLMVYGEAGIGKSRLTREFISKVKDRTIILEGIADPGIQNLPYRPIIDALRSIPIEKYRIHNIQPIWLNETSRLIPELKSLIPDLQGSLVVEEDMNPRLYEALTQILIGLTGQGQTVLLCLDDLHWADRTTLEWLAYMSGKIRSESIFILGAYRSEEAYKLGKLRQSLSRQDILVELAVTGLDRSHVQQILQRLKYSTLNQDQITEHLWRVTAGNPFFLIEILKGMLDPKFTQDGEQVPDRIVIPETVYSAIETRLDDISPGALQVLQASAVLGASFEFIYLQQTAGRSELETLEALDELVHSNILIADDHDYRFHHELIQAAVYKKMTSWRRQALHRRAADWLEVERPDAINALAYHYERAGAKFIQKSITYLILAGDRARKLYGYAESIDLYNRALPLLKEQGDKEQIARIMMKIAQTHQNAFNFKQARRAYNQAFEVWRQVGNPVGHPIIPSAPHPLRYAFADGRGPTYLDPPKAWEDGSISVIDQLFSGLVYIDENMDVIPDTAKNWRVSEGGMEYLFELREDIFWSDGRPLTAFDFEYAWKRALNPATIGANVSSLWDIKGGMAYHEGVISDAECVGVHALDPYKLLVELEEPTSYFPLALNHNATHPIPKHVVETHGEAWAAIDNIVTNGPFLLESWQQDKSLMLSRNPTYYGRRVGNVDQIKMVINQDFDSLMQMYASNQMDIISLGSASIENRKKAINRFPQEYKVVTNQGIMFIGFDVSRPPFDQLLLRQAFAMAINRQLLGKTILGYGKIPAEGGFVPPGIPSHSADIGYPFNIHKARRLMAEAGFPGGQDFPELEALVPSSFLPYGKFLQQQWKDILGVDIQWQAAGWETFNYRLLYDPLSMILTPWFGAFPDPDAYLRTSPLKHFSRWHDEKYDQLIKNATCSPNQEYRLTCYQEADQILIREAVLIPILYWGVDLLVKPWIKSYILSGYRWWGWKDIMIEPHD